MPPGLQRHAETAAMPFSLRGCRTRLSHHRRARRRLDVRPRNLEKFQWLGTFERTAAGCVTARAPSVPSRSSVTGALWIRRGSNPPIFRSDPLRPDSRISDSIEARQTRIPRSERATSLSSDTGPPSTAKSSPRAARWRWRGERSSHVIELHDRLRNTPSMANHIVAMLSKILSLAELIPTMTASSSEPSGRAAASDAIPNSFPRRAPRVRPVTVFEFNYR